MIWWIDNLGEKLIRVDQGPWWTDQDNQNDFENALDKEIDSYDEKFELGMIRWSESDIDIDHKDDGTDRDKWERDGNWSKEWKTWEIDQRVNWSVRSREWIREAINFDELIRLKKGDAELISGSTVRIGK